MPAVENQNYDPKFSSISHEHNIRNPTENNNEPRTKKSRLNGRNNVSQLEANSNYDLLAQQRQHSQPPSLLPSPSPTLTILINHNNSWITDVERDANCHKNNSKNKTSKSNHNKHHHHRHNNNNRQDYKMIRIQKMHIETTRNITFNMGIQMLEMRLNYFKNNRNNYKIKTTTNRYRYCS